MISIIVPVYNAALFLTDCVDSLLGQTTIEPLEIILIDDGSTDNSLSIAQAYAKKHAEDPLRKVVLLTQQHSGQSIARNLGMQKATGEYIAFVDSDDRLAPDWCDRHLHAIKNVDYVQSGYRRTSEGQTNSGWHVGIRRLPIHQYSYTSPCMRLYRRSALKDIRFEGGMIYEDVLFSTDLWLSNPKYKRINYAGYLYTKNPSSTTAVPHPDAQKRVLEELENRFANATTWKAKCILWLTMTRLRIHFVLEMRKKLDRDFVAPKQAAVLLMVALLSVLSYHLSPASAATYYASPDGTGNGSFANPCSFTSGLKKLSQPGDTLYLFSGQYNLMTTDVNNLNGSAAKRIVISGYEGINRSGKYPAILDFRQTEYGKRGLQIQNTCAYLHVKNLTLRYSGKNNLINYGSNCIFENLDIYGSADTGCQMKNGGNNIILNVDSHDNFDYETMSGATANFGGNADGFADKQFTGAGNHYIGCRAWNNSDDGWDFFQRVSSSETVIENCVCYANGAPYYDMSNHPRALGVDKPWFDSKVGTTMTDRYGNTITITLAQFPCQGNGNGFKMGGGYTDHKIIVHHCLAVGNYARGFDQNNNGGTMWIYNNSAYANAYNYGFTTAYGTNTIQNCISFAGKNSDSYKSKTVVTIDHNSWNSGYSVSKNDFQSLDTSLVLIYRTSDGSLSETNFMRLAENSALIDAGIDVNLGYNGYAPDLGCFESPGERHDPEPGGDTVPSIQPEGTHSVAFVTIPGCAEDKPLLQYLRTNDSLWIVETDATDNTVDYSSYEVIVLGSKPSSSASGFTPLKGYDAPMVLLKPWLLKSGVWSWGTAINTQDLSVSVAQEEHPLFRGLTITNGELQVFSQCNTNAVTAISEWSITDPSGIVTLGSPVSASGTTIAELPAGLDCNGTVLPQRMIMIGVSEYSTQYLSADGKKLIENAILYQLGVDMPSGLSNTKSQITNYKYFKDGQLFIQRGEHTYDARGARVR